MIVRIRERLVRRVGSRAAGGTLFVGASLGGAASAFFAAVVAARVLERSDFAAFGAGLAAHSLVTQLAELGFSIVAVTLTARDWHGSDVASARRTIGELAVRRLKSLVMIVGTASALALLVPGLEGYRSSLVISSCGALFASLALFFVAVAQAQGRIRVASSLIAALGLLRFAFVGAAVGLGATSVNMLLVGYAVAAPMVVAAAGFGIVFQKRRAPRAAVRPVGADRRLRRTLALGGVASAGVLNADVLLLLLLTDSNEVAVYVAAWRIAAGVSLFNSSVAGALLPGIMLAKDVEREARRLIKTGIYLAVVIVCSAPALMWIGLSMMGEAGQSAAGPLAILLGAFAIDAFIMSVFQIYFRVGRPAIPVAAVCIELLIVTSVIVVFAEYGSMAPAIGHLAARVVALLVVGGPIVLALSGRLTWLTEVRSPVASTGT